MKAQFAKLDCANDMDGIDVIPMKIFQSKHIHRYIPFATQARLYWRWIERKTGSAEQPCCMIELSSRFVRGTLVDDQFDRCHTLEII